MKLASSKMRRSWESTCGRVTISWIRLARVDAALRNSTWEEFDEYNLIVKV